MATVATISVNFAQYDSISFTPTGVIDKSINPRTLSQYCLGTSSGDLSYVGGFVKKSGDNMSGYLILHSSNPTNINHASSKGYVDSRIQSLSSTVSDSGVSGFVKLTGSTMLGSLLLKSSSPSNNLEAASKGYVDTKAASIASDVQTLLNADHLPKSGGVMSGNINLNGKKITGLSTTFEATDAVSKKYVDDSLSNLTIAGNKNLNDALTAKVNKAGDTMSGHLVINNSSPTLYLQDKDHKSAMLHCNSDNFHVLCGDVNSTTWDKKFSVNGRWPMQLDMPGGIAYFAGHVDLGYTTPTNNNHATSKAYVDSIANTKLNKTGDTLSGYMAVKGSRGKIAINDGGEGSRIDIQSDSADIDNNAAYITFHRPSKYAVKFGLDTNNQLSVGGWSMGNVSHTIYHSGNLPSAVTSLGYAPVNKAGDTMSGHLVINNSSPTLYLRDKEHRSAMLHCNSDRFYVLCGDVNSTSWDTKFSVNGRWPMELEFGGGVAKFAGHVELGYTTPTSNSHAASKAYVDSLINQKFNKNGTDVLTGNLEIKKANPVITFNDTEAGDKNARIILNDNTFKFQKSSTSSSTDYSSNTFLTINLNSLNATFAGDVIAFSDERLKENVLTIENALEKTISLRGVSYIRKENNQQSIGLIAQEVEKVIPEVVSENSDGIKGVAYGNLVGILIEAIKELNAKIEKLENK
jgi:hypothetical protein